MSSPLISASRTPYLNPYSSTLTFQFPPSPENLAFLIDNPKSTHHLRQIHTVILRHDLLHLPVLNSKLQRAYGLLNRLDYAVILFNRTPNRNIHSYISIISADAFHGLHQETILLYIQMLASGFNPNISVFVSVLKSCSLEQGKMVHSQIIKRGFDSDLNVNSNLLRVYTKEGEIAYAHQMFDEMPERDLVSVKTMLECYAKHGELEKARLLFDELDNDVNCWDVQKVLVRVHSERLALAYGLINTEPGTTIRIVGNHRLCWTCHFVMKVVSTMTGRRIVLRHRNHFHHFENGDCSCGNYW